MAVYFDFQVPIARMALERLKQGGATSTQMITHMAENYAPSSVRSVLSCLVRDGLVGKMELPHKRGLRGRQPCLYLLLPKGEAQLAAGKFSDEEAKRTVYEQRLAR